MKTLMYLFVVAILVLAGCAKDDTLFENPDNLELKKAKVPIPVKADCWATWGMEPEIIFYYVPGENGEMVLHYTIKKLILSGTGTHLGKIDDEKSFYIVKNIEVFIGDDGLPYTRNTTEGQVVGANGDGFEFTSLIELSLTNQTYSGKMDIIPGTGTGKFEGSSGSFDVLDGGQDNDGTWFRIEGYLVYK